MARILVVDDEPEILQFVGTALEDEGFAVTRALDGQQAVNLAADQRPDLVVLDMSLPRLDGDDVARELRKAHGEIPILLITADGSAREKALRVGAFDYLPKPFDLDRLLTIVRGCVQP
ncbi:MAG: response regulator [Chloroflexi bacterium]|nr:response regulator [Chloroflexota bacterium]